MQPVSFTCNSNYASRKPMLDEVGPRFHYNGKACLVPHTSVIANFFFFGRSGLGLAVPLGPHIGGGCSDPLNCQYITCYTHSD